MYWQLWTEEYFSTKVTLHYEILTTGDGRNDSPGHSAQFCTYTVMHHDTHDILEICTVDKREVDLKSPNMEKKAWSRAMEFLQDKNITVAEMVTDAHVQITAELSKYN